MEVRLPHALGVDEAARRLRAVAGAHGVTVAPDADPRTGTVERDTALGRVRARFRVEEREVVVEVEKKPAFLPEATVRRVLVEHLGAALA